MRKIILTGAVYVDLEKDLSGSQMAHGGDIRSRISGPSLSSLATSVSIWTAKKDAHGIYDDQGGAQWHRGCGGC